MLVSSFINEDLNSIEDEQISEIIEKTNKIFESNKMNIKEIKSKLHLKKSNLVF